MLHSKSINRKRWLRCIAIAVFWVVGIGGLLAQGLSGELKWIRVGSLQTYFSEQNGEVESGGLNDLNIMFSWPAQYSLQQSTMRSRTMWLGCTNYYDDIAGKTFDYKVIGVGPRSDDDLSNKIFLPPAEFKLVGKFDHPVVIVDGSNATVNSLYDLLDETDENLIADRMLVVKNNTCIGVTVTKKVYAFTQQNHDNYYVFDYVLKNTGINTANGDVNPKKITGFIFYLGFRYTFAGESVGGYNIGWGTWNSAWGRSTINDMFNPDPNAPDFMFRAHFAYYGPNSARAVEDDWGCPNQLDDGVMASAKFGGAVVLHADKSAADKSDDIFQPRTTHFIDTDADYEAQPYLQYSDLFMKKRYDAMTLGHAAQTQAQQVGTGFADLWGPGVGGSQSSMGFGPYDLEPGDSIHIVVAQGIAGISREKNREVGGNWLQWTKKTGTPTLVMPDGSQTTEYNNYKKTWVWTCKDSLIKTFHNATSNYGKNYAIPQPPPPPSEFQVTSGGDRIILEWASNADTDPHFDGYVIYRSAGTVLNPKTVYQKIFECGKANVVHRFDDVTAVRGFDYYYYIQSKDDGTQNDVSPGVPLYSSMFWTVTSVAANLQRPAITTTLDSVRVVPNPYDIRNRMFQFGDKSQYDRIAFFGLPPICKMKIFTERGDMIWEKEHTTSTGDELWDSQTSSGQIITSGIYILYVETPEGQSVYRKFVVIR